MSPPTPDATAAAQARTRLEALATPPGALGRLGETAVWWAGVRGTALPPPPQQVHLHVVAGDHGVTARGVSAFPPAVTPLMVQAFLDGGAAATVLARHLGVSVRTHDLAVDVDWPDGTDPQLYAHKVRRGSGSIDTEDALSPAETDAALAAGARIADASVDGGADLLVIGDMGIGSTTPSAALVAALLGLDAAVATGRGTGVDDEGLARKTAVVQAALVRALELHGRDPVRLLGAVGGADLAAMAGICLQAASRRTPVLLDGVVVTAAALVAERTAPGTAAWFAAGHLSSEPAHGHALTALGLEPLVDLGMRLGEGSGALVALPLLSAAAVVLAETAQLADLLPPVRMRAGAVRDGLRLSVGTLTVLPVPVPVVLDRGAAAVAMTAAVLPGALLGAAVATVLLLATTAGAPGAVAGVLGVGTGVLLTRFLHVDGLADTADGLVASWDRGRALEVMRTGDVGPVGTTVLLLVLGGQAAALTSLAASGPDARTVVGVVLAWAASRAVLPVLTCRGVSAARPDGLGALVVGAVPTVLAVAVPVALAVAALLVGPVGPLAVGAAVLAAGVLARSAHRRLGGLTGDVLGAGVEVALLAALVVLSAAVPA